MQTLKHISASAGADPILTELMTSGGVIVDDLLNAELLEKLNKDADPFLARTDAGATGLNPIIAMFFGDKVRHVSGFAGKSARFAEEVMWHTYELLPRLAAHRGKQRAGRASRCSP